MTLTRAVLAVVVATAGVTSAPAMLRAQSATTAATASVADSLPLRRGQWAAQFRLANDAYGLGALWFRSASSAWLIDGAINAETQRSSDNTSTQLDGRSTSGQGSLRAGLRAYRPVVARVARFHGAGITTTYGRNDSPRYAAWQGGAGVYGELGAAYFVTSHLSLGAVTQANIGYTVTRQRSSSPVSDALVPDARSSRWGVALTGLTMLGTLYF